MSRFRRHPSPALVIACLALAVALGGTGYAAIVLPPNSVGTKQLVNGAVVAAKVKAHSLVASNVDAHGATQHDAGRCRGREGDEGAPP